MFIIVSVMVADPMYERTETSKSERKSRARVMMQLKGWDVNSSLEEKWLLTA